MYKNVFKGLLVAVIMLFSGVGAAADISLIAAYEYNTGDGPRSLDVSDFNGDNIPDLVVANDASSNVVILFGNGDGTFQIGPGYVVGPNPISPFAADFNGDSEYDIAVVTAGDDNISVLINSGSGIFDSPVAYTVGNCADLCGADFDGDNDIDLALARRDIAEISILLNDGDGSFSLGTPVATDEICMFIVTDDLDGDNDFDLIVVNGVWNGDSFARFFNNGDGTFQPSEDLGPVFAIDAICLGHLNEDEYIDMVYGDADWCAALINDGSGGFLSTGFTFVRQTIHSICITDLDGDGDNDIAMANSLFDDLDILSNNGAGFYDGYFSFSGGISPESVVSGDFDGDGDNDLALANRESDYVSIHLNHVCGDVNGDQGVNILDITFLINYLYKDGGAPVIEGAADADGNDTTNLLDITYLINYLYKSGPRPVCDKNN